MVARRSLPPSSPSAASSSKQLDHGSAALAGPDANVQTPLSITLGGDGSSVSDTSNATEASVASGRRPQFARSLTHDGTFSSRASAVVVEGVVMEETSKSTHPQASGFEYDDWADTLPDSEHVRFFKSVDWGKTELGPLESWGMALRIHTFTVMADSRPSTLYWGPNKVSIYNEFFIPLSGKKHPELMGTTFADNFPEIWGYFQGVFNEAEATGKATQVFEMEMFVERSGFVEETYFTGNFTPLRGIMGKVDGFYNAVYENTAAKIRDRRRSIINHMEIPSGLDKPFADCIIPFLGEQPRDIPMALLYELDMEDSVPGQTSMLLRGKLGIPDDHPLATAVLDFESCEGIVPLLRRAEEEILTLPTNECFQGVQWLGFEEPSKHVSIIPLTCSAKLFGFLVVGTNPRLPTDDNHKVFMQDLGSKVSAVATSLVGAEDIRKRATRLEKELADSEKQIRYMAQHASVGMQHLSFEGKTIWANEHYYSMTGHSRLEKNQYKHSFIDVFLEEDQPKALDAWNLLLQGQSNVSVELRLKRLYTPPSGDAEPACILALSFPYLENGKVRSIMTCITDVSSLKWAEASEARNAADAREAKRQQEEFIDLVSHELRNPLSAIFQLADTIISSHPDSEEVGTPEDNPLSEALRSNIEAASTILMCAKHQKRIVDDVLTLSKLEYMMLAIAPRPVQLPKLFERSVRMFDADMLEADISVNISAEKSLQENKVDWVMCDPSRITQIFINLLTNALKFTKTEETREITIKYGATPINPRDTFPHELAWAPNQQDAEDLTLNEEWGADEPIYITLTVTDTGVGMSPDQIKKLFSRFQQASARTTIKYGGSGLGLFISQKLTEKLGGEIGVLSESGRGSMFAFYVKARRTTRDKKISRKGSSTDAPLNRPLPLRTSSSTVKIGVPETNLEKIHVLLVEDNLVNQQILVRQLTKAGCVVYTANHGLEALEILQTTNAWCEDVNVKDDKENPRRHIDIILMDWEMPVMDGLTASREIRRLQAEGKITRYLEIIATTANAREEQVVVALESGIDEVLSKPFRVADLMDRMKERLIISSQRHTSPRIWSTPP